MSEQFERLRQITHTPWRMWEGGECPIAEYENPEVKYRSGGTFEAQANKLRWTHTGAWDDIVAYRIRRPERNNR